jgi:hypothetical protein
MTTLSNIYCGDDDVITATITKNSIALDLTGLLAATFMLKSNVDDADAAALLTKTLAAGIAVTNAAGGIMQITLNAADTVSLPGGPVQAALKIKDASAKTATVYTATLKLVRPAVRVAA